jgi:hypothetical protein
MATRKTSKKSELALAGEHLGSAAKEVGTAITHKFESLGDAMSKGMKNVKGKMQQRRDQAQRKIGGLVKKAEKQLAGAQAQLSKGRRCGRTFGQVGREEARSHQAQHGQEAGFAAGRRRAQGQRPAQGRREGSGGSEEGGCCAGQGRRPCQTRGTQEAAADQGGGKGRQAGCHAQARSEETRLPRKLHPGLPSNPTVLGSTRAELTCDAGTTP